MLNSYILSRSLALAFFLAFLIDKGTDGQVTLESLQERIDFLDQNSPMSETKKYKHNILEAYGGQIQQLGAQLQDQILKESGDFNQLSGRADSAQNQLAEQGDRIATLEGDIGAAFGRIVALEGTVSDLTGRVEKLEAVNKIWRSNFQVVNRTFTELRKKIKFVFPLIRLPNVNYVYIVPNSNIRVTNVKG